MSAIRFLHMGQSDQALNIDSIYNASMENKTKTAVIDTGGGMMAIYGAGVLDFCMKEGIDFDIALGVSAGAGNLVSFVSGDQGRNFDFYTDQDLKQEYMHPRNILKKGAFVDLDYVYSEKTSKNHDNREVFNRILNSDTDFRIVSTNGITGRPVYFDKNWLAKDQYNVFKASCAVPAACKPVKISNIPFFDGTLSDPMPIRKALDLGAEKIVLIVTGIGSPRKTSTAMSALYSLLEKKYPGAAKALKIRPETVMEQLELARRLEAEGKLLILCPEDLHGVHSLSTKLDGLEKLYQHGLEDGPKVLDFLKED